MIQMKNNDSLEQDVREGVEIRFQVCLQNQVHRIAYAVRNKENRKDKAEGLDLAISSFPLLPELAKTRFEHTE